jgi:selenocysteine lyase/cysteine desulfurase
LSAKHLFSRALGAAPERLHMAAHSHHLWPDVSREAQIACWDDAAQLADGKWGKVMGELWPTAQREVAEELGTGMADAVVFAANTHDFLVRLAAAAPRTGGSALRVLTTDGEFHSARRQFARWVESGEIVLTVIAAEPAETLDERFITAARGGGFDLVLVSQILFGSGRRFTALGDLAELADPAGPWVVVDGYHSFMAAPAPLAGSLSANGKVSFGDRLFFLAGGYKYAMAGEGMGLMHCPPGFGPRPPITGWYAEFADLSLPPELVGYAPNAMRFMGATFDPSALYRFTAIREMLRHEGWSTERISAHVHGLQDRLVAALADTVLGEARLLNPPAAGSKARFLALRDPRAAGWQQALAALGCVTDVRGDVLRVGLGLYHDESDVDAFVGLVRKL